MPTKWLIMCPRERLYRENRIGPRIVPHKTEGIRRDSKCSVGEVRGEPIQGAL